MRPPDLAMTAASSASGGSWSRRLPVATSSTRKRRSRSQHTIPVAIPLPATRRSPGCRRSCCFRAESSDQTSSGQSSPCANCPDVRSTTASRSGETPRRRKSEEILITCEGRAAASCAQCQPAPANQAKKIRSRTRRDIALPWQRGIDRTLYDTRPGRTPAS